MAKGTVWHWPSLSPRTPHLRARAGKGWRYLEPRDAPPDLAVMKAGDDELPAKLAAELRELGLL